MNNTSLALLALLAAPACGPTDIKMDDAETVTTETTETTEDTGTSETEDTSPPADTSPPEDTDDTAPPVDTVDTAPPEDTSPPEDTALPVFDCSTISDSPLDVRSVPNASGYHGLAFDEDGYIVGSDNNSLIKADYSGKWSVFVSGLGVLQQMVYLPDGDLAVVSNTGVNRITPKGGQSNIASIFAGYGIVLGPDNMLYTAGNAGIHRIDPDTGASEEFVGIGTRFDTPHSLNFNKDYTRLYVGVVGTNQLYAVDLDEDLNPLTEEMWVFATGVGGGWHDGIAVDACGYLYVVDYWNSGLYRISPDGATVLKYVNWSGNESHYGHGVEFGNGIGGWLEDALYLPMPYNGNTVQEITIGVPSAKWEGEVINAPVAK